jgi:transcriptional regulator with XRE-family HTH domain
MTLSATELQQRMVAARVLRGVSQRRLDELAAADGYGKTELSRVERGELEFRPGKHIDPLCRYLDMPRWWFTVERVELPAEPIDNQRSVEEMLRTQTDLLNQIKQLLDGTEGRLSDVAQRMVAEFGAVLRRGQGRGGSDAA